MEEATDVQEIVPEAGHIRRAAEAPPRTAR